MTPEDELIRLRREHDALRRELDAEERLLDWAETQARALTLGPQTMAGVGILDVLRRHGGAMRDREDLTILAYLLDLNAAPVQ